MFRRQNHVTFIFMKTMSHDLLVQVTRLRYNDCHRFHSPKRHSASYFCNEANSSPCHLYLRGTRKRDVNESCSLCASVIEQVCPFRTVQHHRHNQRRARISGVSIPGFVKFIQSITNNILTALVTFILTSS